MYTLDICMYMYTKFCVTVVFCLENVRMHEESGSSLNSTWHFNSLMVNIVFRKLVIEWSYFSMWRWFLNHLRVCFTCFFLVSIHETLNLKHGTCSLPMPTQFRDKITYMASNGLYFKWIKGKIRMLCHSPQQIED